MEAKNDITLNKTAPNKAKLELTSEDKLALGHMKYALGLGASIRYANELRAVQQVGRLPFLRSSNLHEDVLRSNLGPTTGVIYSDSEESASSRLAFL